MGPEKQQKGRPLGEYAFNWRTQQFSLPHRPSLIEVLAKAENPTIYTYQERPNDLLPEKSLVQSIKEVVKEHSGLVALGIILTASGVGITMVKMTENQSMVQVISSDKQNDKVQNQTEILTTGDYIRIADALLKERGLNLNDDSFIDEMAQKGYSVQLEIFGSQARMAKAGVEGLKVRRAPSLESNYEIGITVEAGKQFAYIAKVYVKNSKDNTTDVFGLLTTPSQMIEVKDQDVPLPAAPNVIKRSSGGFIQVLPGYARLERRLANGSVDKFVQPLAEN